jgi:hypothetical protein
MRRYSTWIRWIVRPILSLLILEVGLSFIPIPDWWEAGVFNEYLYSERIRKMVISKEHNSLGYRDSEWTSDQSKSPHKIPHQKKIVFLGDSRTYGLFVDRNQTYAEQVEQLSDWEGMNLGVPGATTFEALDSMLPDSLPYKPAASVVCLDLNSSLISYLPRANASKRSDILANIFRSSSIWMFIEGGWHSMFSKRVPVLPLTEYKQQLHLIFQKLKDGGVSQNILLVGWTPLKDYPNLYTQETYNQYREVSREVAIEIDIPIIEFTEELKHLPQNEAFVGEHEIHLSPTSHTHIALSILRVLDEK